MKQVLHKLIWRNGHSKTVMAASKETAVDLSGCNWPEHICILETNDACHELDGQITTLKHKIDLLEITRDQIISNDVIIDNNDVGPK